MNSEKFITRRIIAGIIDYTIIFSLTSLYIYIFGESDSEGTYNVSGIRTFPIFIFWLIYICIVEITLKSTLGNYIVGLKPIDLQTEKSINFKQSFLRHIVDLVDMMFFGIVAIMVIKNSKESQRLGDLLAKTKVVRIK
ncbi:RDD family protein [Myroides guanonis]|uniref:Uncharacterized membrane protein YckC, RDD family n=1 Tax=Myroides guanonis TaxID=1150112 RepID=A0A1I3U4U0_9FLAO|nr:RDD family protein [Myroides guanonis]SFJ76797.1 Uncharacterized membrane protein YckC, RDD family [Myroides guanonis]